MQCSYSYNRFHCYLCESSINFSNLKRGTRQESCLLKKLLAAFSQKGDLGKCRENFPYTFTKLSNWKKLYKKSKERGEKEIW